MFYDFPEIKHINDVLPHIEGRDEFKVMDKGDYVVINYMVSFDTTFEWDHNDPIGSSIRRECRGLIFNKNGELISRPYSKFFNVGEKLETQLNKINLYQPHVVLQKIDGSMIRPIPIPDGFVLATKAGVTEISQQAQEFIKNKSHYSTFIRKCIQRGITPLFEWCSNKNRIVVSYPEDQLILTGMRYNDTGKYVDYSVMVKYATAWNIPVVKAVDGLSVQNIELFVKQVREWENGEEGVVVRFDSGHMVKVKSSEYVLRHKTKDSINQEKNVIAVILDDAIDDLVPLLSEVDAYRLKIFQNKFWRSLEDVSKDIYDTYREIDNGQSQKDFATLVVPSLIPQYQPFMFKLRKGFAAKDLVIEQVRKSLSSQTKIDQNRWLWGGLNWNNLDTQEP